jgi:cell division GTPase FtsZ
MKNFFRFIGLGQCGMRIAQEFEKVGFYTAVINSDEVDGRGYNLEEEKILVLKGTGTGKSLKIGKQIIENNKSKFESFIRRNCNKNGLTIFIAGGGGGTGGSFIAPAVEYTKSLGYKVGILYTLPPKMLGIIPAENSLRTLKEILKVETDFFMLIDNELLINEVGKDETWWGKINRMILSTFYSSIEIIRENKTAQHGLGSIDKGELLRSLTYGKGCTDIRRYYLTASECDQDEEKLEELLFKPQLVEGYNYKETKCYLASIDIPQQGNYTAIAKKIFDLIKYKVGNSIAILGMFSDPLLKDSIKVTLINSGLQLPKILQSRIKNLRRDEKAFQHKQEKEDNIVNTFSDLDFDEDASFDKDFQLK